MRSPSLLKRHADLMDRMATAVGVDLETAVMSGDMAFDEIADAVLRCTDCSDPEHCSVWLDQAETPDAAPSICRNRHLFAQLAPEDGA